MSELDKIVEKYQKKYQCLERKLQVAFYSDIGKLQIECKHEKIHWMQELKKDGSLKDGLFKRCLICGSTVETFDTENSFREELLIKFDNEVEVKKLALNGQKETEGLKE
jgi:hypothetical protein